jgi:hypothetical protein
MGKGALPDAGPWIDSVERIGLGGTLIVILVLGFAISLIFRGPGYLLAINELLKTVLKYRSEKKRVPEKVKSKQDNLKAALSARKRNGGGGRK